MSQAEIDNFVLERSNVPSSAVSPFLQKFWTAIPDGQGGNYQGGQVTFTTQAVSNASQYASYREGYIAMPLILSMTGVAVSAPQTATTSLDYGIGLKNWFGQIVHSVQVNMGSSTVVQQTPFCNIWNAFKLMTSLSFSDLSNTSSIGFYPDSALSVGWTNSTATTDGQGTFNNRNGGAFTTVTGAFNSLEPYNVGFLKRQQMINYTPSGVSKSARTYGDLLTANACNNLYKSYIFNRGAKVFQIAVMAQIRLRDLHSFFDNLPLMKGAAFQITLSLNQTQATVTVGAGDELTLGTVNVINTNGTCPFMLASATANNGLVGVTAGALNASCFVGNKVTWQTQITDGAINSPFPYQCTLNFPMYVLSPIAEQSYLQSRVKKVAYTDITQYTISNVQPNGNINTSISNGQAGIKSVLCVPYFSSISSNPDNSGLANVPVLQSPFDSAGGTTSPFCMITNFNVRIANVNQLMDNSQYSYQTFLQNFYGVNGYAGGMTNGLSNGLIGQTEWETSYCFHYVNCSRMPESEVVVPKSVSVLGTNASAKAIDIYCYIEFGCVISVDVLTGARVD